MAVEPFQPIIGTWIQKKYERGCKNVKSCAAKHLNVLMVKI